MARPVARPPRAAPLPDWIPPQLTQLVDAAPEGDQWLHEIKFDGYRMHARLDRGDARRWGAHIVNYADDYVICCKGSADQAMLAMREMMTRLKLTVNEDKTHVRFLPQERFEFLGYSFGRCYKPRTGQAYMGARPSRKSIKRMVKTISQETHRSRLLLEADLVVTRLNRKLEGWASLAGAVARLTSQFRARPKPQPKKGAPIASYTMGTDPTGLGGNARGDIGQFQSTFQPGGSIDKF
jgi:hypothetical protein